MFDSIKLQIANIFSIYLEHLISMQDSRCFVNMFKAHSLLEIPPRARDFKDVQRTEVEILNIANTFRNSRHACCQK